MYMVSRRRQTLCLPEPQNSDEVIILGATILGAGIILKLLLG